MAQVLEVCEADVQVIFHFASLPSAHLAYLVLNNGRRTAIFSTLKLLSLIVLFILCL